MMMNARYDIYRTNITRKLRAKFSNILVKEMVSHYTGISIEMMQSNSRKREIVDARKLSMWYMFRCSNMTWSDIGIKHGGRDHSTSLSAIRAINNRLDVDRKFLEYKKGLDEIIFNVFQKNNRSITKR